MWQEIVACSAAREVAFCIPWFGGTALPIFWYGILASIGIFAGAFYASKHIEREGQDPEIVWDALLWVLVAALVGARLWYVLAEVLGGTATGETFSLTSWQGFLNIINPRSGGMNIFGGVIFGFGAAGLYSRNKKIDGWLITDAGLMGLLIGQAIGRVGNFINQELYGPPTGIEWFGMRVDAENRLSDFVSFPPETRFHPTMFYEITWLLVTFAVLYYLFRRYQERFVHGYLTGAYLILAGFGRFIIEFWRPDQPKFTVPNMGGLQISFSSILSMVYVVVGIVILLDRMGHLRLPFIARAQSRKQRLAAYQEILAQRRRHERTSERERIREQRRKEREQRTAAAAPVQNSDTTPSSGEST
jgi:phosphatidylglycerol:prolipoprotein diacylglycerol transferase